MRDKNLEVPSDFESANELVLDHRLYVAALLRKIVNKLRMKREYKITYIPVRNEYDG